MNMNRSRIAKGLCPNGGNINMKINENVQNIFFCNASF